jgi:hypothetical protein
MSRQDRNAQAGTVAQFDLTIDPLSLPTRFTPSVAMVFFSSLGLPTERTVVLLQAQPASPADDDPLIARDLQHITYIGGFVLAILVIIGLGLLNRQVEYALTFAFLLAIGLIITLLML